MTRRIIKSRTGFFNVCSKNGIVTDIWQCDANEYTGENLILVNPRYKVGETVYLKEPYHVFDEENNLCLYKYPPKEDWMTDKEFSDIVHSLSELKGWHNKLFMPEKYARYFIKITNVRAERLQDISEEDCIREGITSYLLDPSKAYTHIKEYGIKDYMGGFNTPQEAYAALINKINGKDTWDNNPWVWVYDYELKLNNK